MKKITSKNLNNRLSKYGALTVAIAGIADLNGQVMYTDVIPDFTGGATIDYGLDLNNDGIIDFNIDAASSGSAGAFAVFLDNNSIASNSFRGSQPFYTYPFALDSGATVSSGQSGWYNVGTLNYVSCYGGIGSSNWCGVTDKFLGLRFQIAGNTHYGWARLDVSASGDSFTVKDYAYNATPNAPITTDATLGNSSKAFESIKVVALNKSIGLYNLPESTDYTLYNVAGQKVLDGKVNSSTYVVEANGVSSGVYIIEIIDSNTKATLRKKVVL